MMQPKSAQNQSRTDAAENRPSTSGSTSSASTSSGPAASTSTPPARVPTSYVYIDVLPDPGTPPPRLPSLSSMPSSPLSPTAVTSSAIASFVPTPGSPTSPDAGMGLGLNSPGPRVLRHIDPTVTFMSRAALQAHSCFKVTKAGAIPGQAPVHTERTELELLSSSCMPMPQWSSEIQCTFLYRTPFVPRFWDSLCRSSGEYLTRITILAAHTVTSDASPAQFRPVGLHRPPGDRPHWGARGGPARTRGCAALDCVPIQQRHPHATALARYANVLERREPAGHGWKPLLQRGNGESFPSVAQRAICGVLSAYYSCPPPVAFFTPASLA